MKKNLFITTVLTLMSTVVLAQKDGDVVNYKVEVDDPDNPANLIICMDLLQGEFSGASDFNQSSLNLGAYAIYDVNSKLGFEALVRKSYLLSNFDAELGGKIAFMSSHKTRQVPVHLKTSGDVSYSVQVPATINQVRSLHGGVISKLNLTSQVGIYAGLHTTNYRNLTINTENFGRKSASLAYQVSWDVLFSPVKWGEDNSTDESINKSPIGGRFTMRMFGAIPKNEGGGTKPFVETQVGFRPYTGFYFNFSFGFTILKKRVG